MGIKPNYLRIARSVSTGAVGVAMLAGGLTALLPTSVALKADTLSPLLARQIHVLPRSAGATRESRLGGFVSKHGNLIDGETLLLQYVLGDQKSFLYAVTDQSEITIELPPRAEIEKLVRRTSLLVQRGDRIGVATGLEIVLSQLSDFLLGPVSVELRNKKRLQIFPDGDLWQIPFAALPIPKEARSGSILHQGRQPPLAEQHEITLVPTVSSARHGLCATNEPEPRPLSLAIIADPVYSSDDPRLSRQSDSIESQRVLSRARGRQKPTVGTLRRLPYTNLEAQRIIDLAASRARILGATGLDANRDRVISGELQGYRILHFATHGMVQQNDDGATLVLSTFDAAGKQRDGLLGAAEISQLKLDADLVVLSACQTALSHSGRDPGEFGLTRAFFDAGARQLLVSLWAVNDRGTAELMSRFYRGLLQDELPAAAALRQAQLSMRSESSWQSPVQWAGFVLLQGTSPECS